MIQQSTTKSIIIRYKTQNLFYYDFNSRYAFAFVFTNIFIKVFIILITLLMHVKIR